MNSYKYKNKVFQGKVHSLNLQIIRFFFVFKGIQISKNLTMYLLQIPLKNEISKQSQLKL